MHVVTAGYNYLDIDAYGGIVAKAELLNLQGVEAIATSTAPLNESIPPSVLAWNAPLVRDYSANDSDSYVLVDISEPDYFERFVALDRVTEIIDHHPGTDKHWTDRNDVNVQIEDIGAACTQVFEHWGNSSLTEKMHPTTAKLLAYGILDNTLNFGAHITTERDRAAYNRLLQLADAKDNFAEAYFKECEQTMLLDMPKAVINDMKKVAFKSFEQAPVAFGQLAVWNAQDVLYKEYSAIKDTLFDVQPHWFMNLISISDGASYFISDNTEFQAWLSNLLSITFENNTAKADRLWLRKEVIKRELSTH